MRNIFADDGAKLWDILWKINSYNVDSSFSSLKKTIRNFNFVDVYTDVLKFMEYNIGFIEDLEEYLEKNITKNNDVTIRLKAEASLKLKWDKNLGKAKQLREVCNDILGIRIITSLTQRELEVEIDDIIKTVNEYKVDVVNFYSNPKAKDDGYRGIHLYFRNNPKCYPVEIQFWTRKDWLLNKYTHEVIYKQDFKEERIIDYPLALRIWIEEMPKNPEEVISFEDYLYTMLQSVYKEGE
ncbi:MAG TPA: hypothetical protein PLH43_03445 [Acetivibrio sp.]|uniref:hypothetical protein n=1 Tax=Acetivibrio sp. TaxID=1872092 RepID=UPI002C677152|nr:hypothetical protein [Acetivibrio sp.]HOM01864.1 hypothetical protein [Acetivibrio sp.]